MDDDLESLSREQLFDEVKRLRAGHGLCRHQPALWAPRSDREYGNDQPG
jgi:hypothetical protein